MRKAVYYGLFLQKVSINYIDYFLSHEVHSSWDPIADFGVFVFIQCTNKNNKISICLKLTKMQFFNYLWDKDLVFGPQFHRHCWQCTLYSVQLIRRSEKKGGKIGERSLMTSLVSWPFLTYLPTLSYSITSLFGGYLGPPYLP